MKISVKWQPKISQNKFKMVLWCCFFIVCFYFLLLQRRPRNQSCFTTPSFCIKGVKLSHTGRRKGMRGDDGSHDENYWAVCIIFFPWNFCPDFHSFANARGCSTTWPVGWESGSPCTYFSASAHPAAIGQGLRYFQPLPAGRRGAQHAWSRSCWGLAKMASGDWLSRIVVQTKVSVDGQVSLWLMHGLLGGHAGWDCNPALGRSSFSMPSTVQVQPPPPPWDVGVKRTPRVPKRSANRVIRAATSSTAHILKHRDNCPFQRNGVFSWDEKISFVSSSLGVVPFPFLFSI